MPHISVSQLQMYQRCGVQYEFRYVKNEIAPPGIAQIRGTGVHAAVAHNFRQKVASRVDLPTDEVTDVAAQKVHDQFHGGLVLQPEEKNVGIDTLRGRTQDVAVAMTRAHHEQIAPATQPVMVEQRINFRAEPGTLDRDLLGILDLVDEAGVVRDTKTASKKPAAEDVHVDQQLTMYSLLYWAKAGKAPAGVGLDTIVQTEAGNLSVNQQRSTRDLIDIKMLVARLQTAVKGISAGIFMPTNPRNWWCSNRWCGYWNVCPYVRSGARQ